MAAIRDTQPSVKFMFPNLIKGVVLVKPEQQDSLFKWTQGDSVSHLKSNLEDLRHARKKLHYLLKEVEELLKK